MNKLEIQTTNTNDAPIIALLARVTFAETFGHLFRNKQDLLDYYNSTFLVDKIANSITKPNNIYWVSFVDGFPVGYAKLKLNSTSEFLGSEKVCQLQKKYMF
tara:strand:- start:80290 stop:80595 length:306 start_codon:yes stop_codon:yes gene_type:complete